MLAIAIAKDLATAGLVSLALDDPRAGGDCFIGHMPDQPDQAVAVMPGAGLPQPSRLAYDLPTVQILVRGAKHRPVDGYTRARAIFDRLHCLDLSTLDDGGADEVFVQSCTADQSDPVPLGLDRNGRPEWSLNFTLSIASPSLHRL